MGARIDMQLGIKHCLYIDATYSFFKSPSVSYDCHRCHVIILYICHQCHVITVHTSFNIE